MRNPHRGRAVRPANRTALAAALALAFGATGAQATNIDVPGGPASFTSLSQAITQENQKADCTGDTITVTGPFVVAESSPLPTVTCPNLTIQGSGTFPYGGRINGAAIYAYGGTTFACGLEANAPINVLNLEIDGFPYGGALCGEFISIRANHLHDNSYGISLGGSAVATTIGGPNASDGNFIYANASFGVSPAYGGSMTLTNNTIGLAEDGSAASNQVGVYVGFGSTVTVDSNVISGNNSADIVMYGGGVISNNLVGTDPTGRNGIGGSENIVVSGSSASITGNTIAGAQTPLLISGSSSVQVQGNNIGVGSNGAPLANGATSQIIGVGLDCSTGVQLSGNVIGGTGFAGVLVLSSPSSTLDGNWIGTGSDGVTPLGNFGYGVLLEGTSCSPPQITAGAHGGKRFTHSASHATRFQSASGITFHANVISNNAQGGVVVDYGGMSSNNLFEANTIAFNGGSGGIAILDASSIDNAIVGNSIHHNTPKNIDINSSSPGTPLPNDPGDVPSGANEGLNHPEILSVVQNGTASTTITYRMDTRTDAAHDYVVEFFANPAGTTIPSATTSLGNPVLLSGLQGVGTFTQTYSGSPDNISATATLSTGASGWIETSELSPVVTATVVPITVTMSPTSTDFGGTPVNDESDSRIFTLTNESSSNVPLGTPSVTGPFRIVTSSCLNVLVPHDSCTVEVRFDPAHSGSASGALSVPAGASNATATLIGTGLDVAQLDLPSVVDFGTYVAGSPPIVRTVTLKSSGTGVVTIDQISVSGPFALTHDCPLNLKPGNTCTLTLSFASNDAGAANGAVTIHSNSIGSSTIALTGVSQVEPVPIVSVSPQQISFGDWLIGQGSPSVRVLVKNSGSADALLGDFSVSGDFEILGKTCGATLAPQATCSADVLMRPLGFGSRPGVLSITSNADGSPHRVDLGGRGCRLPGFTSNRGGSTDPCAP